ncbi:MAG: class I SAM-dependent methyltransferase [Anaerolineales bacterium]
MTSGNDYNTPSFAQAYLERAGEIPHRGEGEAALLEALPARVRRVLDLGCGDGRVLALVLAAHPQAEGVALDGSPTMLAAARERFAGQGRVTVVALDLAERLPELGVFDAIVSAFAIHHLAPARQGGLYGEIWAALRPGGVFANLEHVSSPTARLEELFYNALGTTAANRDPSNQCVRLGQHLEWLAGLGFEDADCLWKWRELALVAGVRAAD